MVTKATSRPPIIKQDALASVEHTDDVVEFTLRCVLAMAPQLNEAVAQLADRHVREMFGGSRPYIARRAGVGTDARNDRIRREYLMGERISLLARRHGVSERQIMRVIKGGVD